MLAGVLSSTLLAGCGVLAPPGLAEALFVFLINPEAVEAEPDFIALIRLLVSATGVILLRGSQSRWSEMAQYAIRY